MSARLREPRLTTVVGASLVFVAVCMALYPDAVSWWGSIQAHRQFSLERNAASQGDAGEIDSVIAAAIDYNVLVGAHSAPGFESYSTQLSVDGASAMCWIEIPKLDVVLPVYHDDGTEEVPAEGAEHLFGSSLPVGGAPSNVVITAHTGAHRGAPMAFNRLDALGAGDEVVVWTCGRPFAYDVVGSEVVAPEEVPPLLSVHDSDELTLLTCWPIGTSARRLVVRAERVGYEAPDGAARVDVAGYADPDVCVAAVVAMGAVLTGFPALVALGCFRRRLKARG